MGDKGERTRKQIRETATTLFHLRGYQNTSMDDIVRRSGVTKGNLYYYFPSKEALGRDVVEHVISEWLSTGINFTEIGDPIREIMAMFQRAEKELSEMKCRGGCLFGNLALEVSDLHDGLRQILKDAFTRWETRVATLLESGKHRGVLRMSVHPKRAARFIVATFEGGILLSKVKKDVQEFRSCKEMMKNILEGFRA